LGLPGRPSGLQRPARQAQWARCRLPALSALLSTEASSAPPPWIWCTPSGTLERGCPPRVEGPGLDEPRFRGRSSEPWMSPGGKTARCPRSRVSGSYAMRSAAVNDRSSGRSLKSRHCFQRCSYRYGAFLDPAVRGRSWRRVTRAQDDAAPTTKPAPQRIALAKLDTAGGPCKPSQWRVLYEVRTAPRPGMVVSLRPDTSPGVRPSGRERPCR
jgi:hypothetical protein